MAINLQKLEQKFSALFENENIVTEFEQWLKARNVSTNDANPNVTGSTLWICIYQYKGMETEGHLRSNELMVVRADDKVEALWKYHVWTLWRENRLKDLYHKSLSEYKKSQYASGGWGYFAYKIDDCNENERDDSPFFYETYNLYCH